MNYDKLFSEIVSQYSAEELTQICKGLNKAYNIYDPEDVRWKKVSYYLFRTSESAIAALREVVLSNKFISDLFLEYYVCERVVKYFLIQSLLELTNDIVAFEMTVGGSRVDICRINGGSYAYEIKTEYDSFERLATQMNDYIKAFEKVYVVVPHSRELEIQPFIPAGCGIISYRQSHNKKLVFSYRRRSEKNECDVDACISSLSSNELSDFLKLLKLGDRDSKEKKLNVILDYSAHNNIWPTYRRLLKTKYKTNWQFLKDHFDEIIPIDIQSFFSTNMDPSLLYEAQTGSR